MILVIHVNHFTGKIEGGYLLAGAKKVGRYMNPRAVLLYRAANPETECEFLNV